MSRAICSESAGGVMPSNSPTNTALGAAIDANMWVRSGRTRIPPRAPMMVSYGQPSIIERNLALGVPDAQMLYLGGLVAMAAGDAVEGRERLRAALALNPAFDPTLAADARRRLADS